MNTAAEEEEEALKLKTEELISKTEELKQTSNSLLESNNALKLMTEELVKTHTDLFESNHQLASVNKELVTTNKRFAETNKMFAHVIEELSLANKDLAKVNKELALANEQIKAQEQTSKDFINIAAHEIRTPTQSIIGYSELLQILFEQEEGQKQVIVGNEDGVSNSNGKEDYNEKKKALEAIIRNASRLGKLANGILDITKIESNTLTLDKQRFSVTEKIRDAIADVITNQMRKDASKNKNIKINFASKGEGEGRKNDIFIDADKTRIYQVISNLLENAIKFAKEGGTIIITADVNTDKIAKAEGRQRAGEGEERQEVVVVKVSDTGTGIDASILPRLFTKFATSSSEGVGLGLYISKSIVEAHGGRMWAENNLDGKGATFAFTLPCLLID
jgi:signal transduction histidine kinase